MTRIESCIRCGLPSDHESHHSSNTNGWHPFRDQSYVDALEDALLFIRERNQPHQWRETGAIIDISPSFPEKRCRVCGAVNWGGEESGVCFGDRNAELAIVEAHNRRAALRRRAHHNIIIEIIQENE